MTSDRLGTRALNRALLARQHLLERATMPPLAMLEHLVAMQAQNPLDPYAALWSRLEGFDPATLSAHIEARDAVRMGLLRTTLHLVSAADAPQLWPLLQPVLARAWHSSPFRRDLPGVEFVEPTGAFYFFFRVDSFGRITGTQFCTRLVTEKGVALVPGAAFGDDRWVRLSYAAATADIARGLDRIVEFSRSLTD
jgi:hypothetical protein